MTKNNGTLANICTLILRASLKKIPLTRLKKVIFLYLRNTVIRRAV